MNIDQECRHVEYCPVRTEPHPPFIGLVTKKTYAIVLAGGRGSRLQQLTDWRSKPAVPFGGKLRIIDFALSNCVNSGIRRIGVVTQYKAQSLIRHIQHGWLFHGPNLQDFVDVIPAQQRVEDIWYQGTADAVFQNLDILRTCEPDYVLVLAGDHVYKMDYGRLLADHIAESADLTLACTEVPLAEARRFGIVTADMSGRVSSFLEKPQHPRPAAGQADTVLASMGIYVFNASFLYEQLVRDADDPNSKHDFGRDLVPYLVPRCRAFVHRFAGSCVSLVGEAPYWRDVGTVDAYWEANIGLTKVTPELNLYDEDWPIWSHQQHLPPAKFVFDDEERRGHAMDSLISGGCIVSGATVRRSLLFSKVRIQDYSSIEDSVVLPSVEIGRHVTLKRTIIDKYCSLPDGFTAGVDPERDRVRFHVTEGGITLVTPEMLGQKIHYVR